MHVIKTDCVIVTNNISDIFYDKSDKNVKTHQSTKHEKEDEHLN